MHLQMKDLRKAAEKENTKDKKKRKTLTVRSLCLYSLLAVVLFVSKMALAALPNVEPVSLIVLLLAQVFGWPGLISVFLYILLENLMWGINIWSLCYLYVWLILFAAAMAIRNMKSPLGWALVCGSFGLLFGLLCLPTYLLFGGPSLALDWWISGLPWDVLHGVSNFLLCLLLYSPLKAILMRLVKNPGNR